MRYGNKLGAAAAVAAAAAAIVASTASATAARALFAAANGSGSSCTASQPCPLAAAIERASTGATVHVAKGKYNGGYVIDKRVRLVADGRVVVDASTSADGTGIHIVGPGGSGSVVQGFVV